MGSGVAKEDCRGSRTITLQSDADDLADCSTFDGDVRISPSAAGNITINGLKKVNGDFLGGGDGEAGALLGITSDSLIEVGGDLTIDSLQYLQTITLPKLRKVKGVLRIAELPALDFISLRDLNAAGSLAVVSAPKLAAWELGTDGFTTDPDIGFKHVTSETSPTVEIRDVALSNLNDVIDIWNASSLSISGIPNVEWIGLRVDHVGEVNIAGNGELVLHLAEKELRDGMPQPVISTLRVSGVKHISPCNRPDVHEFVFADNPEIEYLHFSFRNLVKLEVMDNPLLRYLVQEEIEFYPTSVEIRDNPLLELSSEIERAKNDTRTAEDCPTLWGKDNNPWRWRGPDEIESIVVSANVDNSFFASLIEPWHDIKGRDSQAFNGIRVTERFEVESTNPEFSCKDLDALRSQKREAIQGEYSCQGKTVAAAGPRSLSSGSRAVSLAGLRATCLTAAAVVLLGS